MKLELILVLQLSQSFAFSSKLPDYDRKSFGLGSLLAQTDAEGQSFGVKA